jgi:hypothetical protein
MIELFKKSHRRTDATRKRFRAAVVINPAISKRVIAASLGLFLAVTSLVGVYVPAEAATPTPVPTPSTNASKVLLTSPKGHPPTNGIVPQFTTCGGTCYRYGDVKQSVTNTGATFTIPVTKPTLDTRDTYHTLVEMSVQDGSGNIIEIGYTVDNTGVNGTDHVNPHLFNFYWVANSGMGYNTNCTPAVGATFTQGQDLSSFVGGSAMKFDIEHVGSAWKLRVNNTDLCSYADSLWSGTYTSSTFIQVFTELALNNRTDSESDAAGGVVATSTVGTPITNFGLYGGGTANLVQGVVTNAARWNAVLTSSTSANVGGAGGHPDGIAGCNGVGTGGYGQWCWYSNTSGGVPINQQTATDATVARNTCILNQGSSDAGGHTIRTVVNTAYVTMDVYNTANCTGTPTTITSYGQTNLPAGYAAAAHMSFTRRSTVITCGASSPPSC